MTVSISYMRTLSTNLIICLRCVHVMYNNLQEKKTLPKGLLFFDFAVAIHAYFIHQSDLITIIARED